MIEKTLENEIIARLVDAYQPRTIYLFGSHAWGNPDKYSDVDILIVVDHSPEKLWKRPIAGIRSLQGLRIDKDILVYTQDEFNEMVQNDSSLFFRIKKEGRIIYEAA